MENLKGDRYETQSQIQPRSLAQIRVIDRDVGGNHRARAIKDGEDGGNAIRSY